MMKLRTIALSLLWMSASIGCSDGPPALGEEGPANAVVSPFITPNGIWQNGLTTNGVWENGIWQNGVWQNGVWQNAVWENGVWQNGVWQNGVWQNGVWRNGVWQNGVWQNGVWQNGVWQNGVWQNGVWQNGVWQNGLPGETLRSSPYARQLLQYVYACAMPGTMDGDVSIFRTTLDPNNGTLRCSSTQPCDSEYACSAQGTCVIPLTGAIGVGVNADGTTWWESGRCDASCQRWVSACVLARANAYGVRVDISMRAPDNAPAAIKAALATTQDERATYTLREGAYYGNIFGTTADPPAPPTPDFTGPSSGPIAPVGPIAGSPSLFACAGPNSNTPEITKRFCSSQGDQVVINVPSTCLSAGREVGVCAGMDATGSIYGCNTSTTEPRTRYDEVVTVYLKQSIAVCGNAVCEAGEASTADAGYCPNDCRNGSWAKSLLGLDNGWSGISVKSAVDPVDGGVIISGVARGGATVVADRTSSPPLTLPGNNADYWHIVLIKYDAEGRYLWSKRFAANDWRPLGAAVMIARDQSILLSGPYDVSAPPRQQGAQFSGLWVAKFDRDGTLVSPLPVIVARTPAANETTRFGVGGVGAGVDSRGDLFMMGTFQTPTTFGSTTLLNTANDHEVYVAKICGGGRADCTLGDVLWANVMAGENVTASLAVDGNDDVLAATYWSGRIYKLSGAAGTVLRRTVAPLTIVHGVASDPLDPNLDFYATGQTATGFRLLKYAADGTTTRWTKDVQPQCLPSTTPPCVELSGSSLTFDGAGHVIAGGAFGKYVTVDFGSGPLTAYRYPSLFLAAYQTTDGTFSWSKSVPTILGGPPGRGFTTVSNLSLMFAHGRLFLEGRYAGSMQLDGRMLASALPESPLQVEAFVGSFIPPSSLDAVPPSIGEGKDQSGNAINTVPKDIFVQATSAGGAPVFYMPPTAIDDANSGTSVACTPPPHTVFPIGTTQVSCTASDALGNRRSATFNVTVSDTVAPLFAPALNVAVPAGGAAGATVTYQPPHASDQVDGATSEVACSPPSGSSFPVGTTTVTCQAKDRSQNTAQMTFAVVVQRGDIEPPTIIVPPPMTVDATDASGAFVTYSASATDDVGVTSFECTPASGNRFSLGATTVTCTASDAVGNHPSATFEVKVADRTPPTLTVPTDLTVNATGANGANVTFTAAATDNVDGTIPITCAPSSGSVFSIGRTIVTCTAADMAGNSSNQDFTVTVAGTQAPSLTLPGPIAVSATSTKGTVVNYAVSSKDVAGAPLTPVCSRASGTKFALGITVVTCKASDTRGTVASGSFPVHVSYAWSGVLAPIDPAGNSVFQLGRTIPVKFRLVGASAAITNAVAKLTKTKVSTAAFEAQVDADADIVVASGNTFRYESGQYVFNLSTKTMSAGTWNISIDLADGVRRTVSIVLRK